MKRVTHRTSQLRDTIAPTCSLSNRISDRGPRFNPKMFSHQIVIQIYEEKSVGTYFRCHRPWTPLTELSRLPCKSE